ncbi:MAG: bifunctional diguanylate cyclase/phosphodiesterase, partial [Gammaproteobacteria bacterium]|nr:bifunctional diguanylate cyclase/phosphodiesterase [Gammaproteobacteria bacterium]
EQAILRANRDNTLVSILMVDLDHFKEINDTLGHHVGDQLLKKVSDRLESTLRKSDTIGRLGGDEFAIIVPDACQETAALVAQTLIQSLQESIVVEGQVFSIGASIGIATYPAHGTDVSTLLKRADVAMYVAKRSRSGYFVYDSEEDRHSPGRLALMSDLRQKITDNRFSLHYQPKIDISNGCIAGVEALARWPDDDDKFIPTDLFIPVMEQTGLIRPFTTWVLEEALGQCARWDHDGLDITVSVNLSTYNLRDNEFPDIVCACLERWKLSPEKLILEITESAVMGDNRQITDVLETLTAKGIQFSIDDFGTGYSSLTHLKKLKVSELKVDKSFVTSMAYNKDDEVIVRSIIDLGHNLGLRIVAEGVETSEVLERLKDLGCEQFQGYLISPALPAEQLIELIKSSK